MSGKWRPSSTIHFKDPTLKYCISSHISRNNGYFFSYLLLQLFDSSVVYPKVQQVYKHQTSTYQTIEGGGKRTIRRYAQGMLRTVKHFGSVSPII